MKDFVKLSLKGEEFTFTALDFGQLQELEGDFAALKGLDGGGMPDAAQRKSIVAICTASLQGKHPGITAQEVANRITLANIGPALQAVAGVSSLVQGEPSGNV